MGKEVNKHLSEEDKQMVKSYMKRSSLMIKEMQIESTISISDLLEWIFFLIIYVMDFWMKWIFL